VKRILAALLIGLFLTAPAMGAGLTIAWAAGYPIVTGNVRQAVVTITFDSSYPTGGESFTAADLGFTTLDFVSVAVDSCKTFEVEMRYNYSTAKMLAFYTANGDTALSYRQPKATSNLALCTAKFFISGN